ncbi:MAG TPA: glycosyltransferase [Bryobacteraceae bacterium]|nr:glycosyltransferase [Bryobacteraceae bacterium]
MPSVEKVPCHPRSLILLAYYYLPDNTSGVQRAVRLAKYLPRHGYDTIVVCSSHAGELPGAQNVLHVPDTANRWPRVKFWSTLAARVQRFFLPYNEQLPWVPYAIAAAQHLISQRRVAAVVSTSPPLASHFAALWLKKRHGLTWIADFRDPLLGNPVRSRKWAKLYDMVLQRWIFSHADAVIAVTDAVANEWRARYPYWAHKIHLIWNGFDPEDAIGPAPIPPRPYRILAHIGILYVQRHPLAMASSMERLLRRGLLDAGSIRLRFVGPIQQEVQFTSHPAIAALMQNGCLEMDGQLVPRQQAMRELATSDFLLLLDIVNLSNVGYTVPAKLYDYVLAGRPVLAVTDHGSPVERILAQSGILYVCLYHDDSDEELDRKLLTFFQLPTEPRNPSPWFLEQFDGSRQAENVAGLLNKLFKE